MSLYESHIDKTPSGFGKIFAYHWALTLLIIAASTIGFLMLFSVADGDINRWARPQMIRFSFALALMTIMAFIPISVYRGASFFAYLFALALLVAVEYFGDVGKGHSVGSI